MGEDGPEAVVVVGGAGVEEGVGAEPESTRAGRGRAGGGDGKEVGGGVGESWVEVEVIEATGVARDCEVVGRRRQRREEEVGAKRGGEPGGVEAGAGGDGDFFAEGVDGGGD